MSDVGNVRTINQDYVRYYQKNEHESLVVLCDGMGGHNAGEIASQMVGDAIVEQYVNHALFEDEKMIHDLSLIHIYTVKYTVADAAGNKTTKTLSVKVENPIPTHAGVASSALSRVGSRYVTGGNGPRAFDCSGLTQWAYRQNGISIPRTAAAQYGATSRVSKSSLKAGDLVFFRGTTGRGGITHVGIYVGGGRFVHAGTSRTGVTTANLNSSYWSSHWAGGGRK